MTSGCNLSLCLDPLADFGVTLGTGVGEGDLLGVADELGIVCVVLVFGIPPEVNAVGGDGVVLGLDEAAEDEDDDGRAALAEVLGFGALTSAGGIAGGASGTAGGWTTLAWTGGARSGINSAILSEVVTVYQLNLNSGTVLVLQSEVCRFRMKSTIFVHQGPVL